MSFKKYKNMAILRFEDMIAWQKSQDIACDIYREFGNIKDFSFRDQICRAVVSISNNLAEGFDRKGDKEFVRFINISHGSCSEVKSMLYLAERLNYFNRDMLNNLLSKTEEIQKILTGLKKSITNRT